MVCKIDSSVPFYPKGISEERRKKPSFSILKKIFKSLKNIILKLSSRHSRSHTAPHSKKISLQKDLIRVVNVSASTQIVRTAQPQDFKAIVDIECQKIKKILENNRHDKEFLKQTLHSNFVGIYSKAKDKVVKYYVANRLCVPTDYLRDLGMAASTVGLPGSVKRDGVFIPDGAGMNVYLMKIKEALVKNSFGVCSATENDYIEQKLIELTNPLAQANGWISADSFYQQLEAIRIKWWPEITRF